MEQNSTARKAIVVGAGPVGCLCAISLAKQGWRVEIYEGRPGKSKHSVDISANSEGRPMEQT